LNCDKSTLNNTQLQIERMSCFGLFRRELCHFTVFKAK